MNFREDRIKGYNTDGWGALEAIESHLPVKNKKIVILGAGGATRAIAWEAKRRGANVVILNRTAAKAKTLADEFGCSGGGFDILASGLGRHYDLILNSTPDPLPIDPKWLLPGAYAMEINTRPKETAFIQEARSRGCPVIYGEEMFLKQAQLQLKIWFKTWQ